MPPPLERLYLITDRRQVQGEDIAGAVRSALEGGARLIQLREKDLPTSQLFHLACELNPLIHDYGGRLIINGSVEVALASGAAGVQLGAATLPVKVVREQLGFRGFIGYSAHRLPEALKAQEDGADFITFSPIYPTKYPEYGPPQGIRALSGLCKRVMVPVFALGGITAERVEEVMRAGAYGVALISHIFASTDIAARTREVLEALRAA
ncbi:MAG: thiamine phosphate synthase [Nitrospinota bacterium]